MLSPPRSLSLYLKGVKYNYAMLRTGIAILISYLHANHPATRALFKSKNFVTFYVNTF
jgi:hypothetical protein